MYIHLAVVWLRECMTSVTKLFTNIALAPGNIHAYFLSMYLHQMVLELYIHYKDTLVLVKLALAKS